MTPHGHILCYGIWKYQSRGAVSKGNKIKYNVFPKPGNVVHHLGNLLYIVRTYCESIDRPAEKILVV